eukprot:TRINITY_DN28989_c0_g1_i1.p1 TRINITY_DN28989_c0_g1~~TRINITY_DN28989_c0_g1_i1.p1  ORF type:complete len:494 (-),score=63.41 TRINITY_DN28989_c0_g1_i1:99-1580(-)
MSASVRYKVVAKGVCSYLTKYSCAKNSYFGLNIKADLQQLFGGTGTPVGDVGTILEMESVTPSGKEVYGYFTQGGLVHFVKISDESRVYMVPVASKAKYLLKPILLIEGGSKGYKKEKIITESGYHMTNFNKSTAEHMTEQIRHVVTETAKKTLKLAAPSLGEKAASMAAGLAAGGPVGAALGWATSVLTAGVSYINETKTDTTTSTDRQHDASLSSTKNHTYEFKRVEKEMVIDLSQPCYLYESVLEIHLDNGDTHRVIGPMMQFKTRQDNVELACICDSSDETIRQVLEEALGGCSSGKEPEAQSPKVPHGYAGAAAPPMVPQGGGGPPNVTVARGSPIPTKQEPITPWSVGDLVEVFSNSKQMWISSHVSEVSGGMVKVSFQYPESDQWMDKYVEASSTSIRRNASPGGLPAAALCSAVIAGAGPSVDSLSPDDGLPAKRASGVAVSPPRLCPGGHPLKQLIHHPQQWVPMRCVRVPAREWQRDAWVSRV